MSKPSNGRKPGSVLTATCRQCGESEPSSFAGSHFMCQACQLQRVSQVRVLAADGLSQSAIARAMGLSQSSVGDICQKQGIATVTCRSVGKPAFGPGITAGPSKLMPTRRAIQYRNIFDFAAAA